MEYWEDKNKLFKLRMNDVFKEQIKYLETIVPSFKVASAVSHFDEHSPHLHIVGVPFKTGNKNGMEVTVGKSAIFTKDSLKVIQDKMRVNCIGKFNEIYDIDLSLKEKRKGKNFDLKSSEMETNTEILKEKTDYLIDKLKKILDKLPKIIKDIIDRLFIHNDIQINYFKQQYDTEEKEKSEKERFKLFQSKQKDNPVYEIDYQVENQNEKDDFER